MSQFPYDKGVEALLKHKIRLERNLKQVKKLLEPFETKTKEICRKMDVKQFSLGPFQFTYTPKRKYLSLAVRLEDVQEQHPKWVEEKEGYERLTAKLMEELKDE